MLLTNFRILCVIVFVCTQTNCYFNSEKLHLKDGAVDFGNPDVKTNVDLDAGNPDGENNIDLDSGIPDTIRADFTTDGFVLRKAGTFSMGSPNEPDAGNVEKCRETTETQHQVTLTHDFEISTIEVTQGQFYNLMKYNPSYFNSCGLDCPVERVNWYEAAAYCNALSLQKGLAKCYACSGNQSSVTCTEEQNYTGVNIYKCPGYRLCTEAEWEYAYRAGTNTAFYNGDITSCSGYDPNLDKIAWYNKNSSGDASASWTIYPVRKKDPNNWGLYDMAGNVLEWCHDWKKDDLGTSSVTDPWGESPGPTISIRVVRGGAYNLQSEQLRAADRGGMSPTSHIQGQGFRCCRSR